MRICLSSAVLLSLALALPVLQAGGDKVEPGFTPLFNGKNFDGWKTKKGGEALDGKTEALKGRFKAVDGKLIIDPKVGGDVIIETVKELSKDAVIKFDFLPGDKCNNDLFFRGIKFDIVAKQLKNVKDGEWNQLEIISKGDTVEYKCNGKLERSVKGKGDKSTFGLRAEFGAIEIKNWRFKEGS